MAKHTPAHETRPVKPVKVRNPKKGRNRINRKGKSK